MPFDGTMFDPQNAGRNQKEVRILKELDQFFSYRERWLRHAWHDNERSCIVDAYRRTKRKLRIGSDKTPVFVHRAIREYYRSGNIIAFNDVKCHDFFEMKKILSVALVLAENFWPSTLPSPPEKLRAYDPAEPWEITAAHFISLQPRPRRTIAGQLELSGV